MPRSRSSRRPMVSNVGVTSTSSLVSNSTLVMSSSLSSRFRAEPEVAIVAVAAMIASRLRAERAPHGKAEAGPPAPPAPGTDATARVRTSVRRAASRVGRWSSSSREKGKRGGLRERGGAAAALARFELPRDLARGGACPTPYK